MRKSLSSAAAAVILSAVFASGSVFAAQKADPKKGGAAADKGAVLKQGKQMDGQKGETVEIKLRSNSKQSIAGIPAERRAEFEAAAKNLTGDEVKAMEKLVGEDQRALLTGKIANDAVSNDLASEGLRALQSNFENAADIAKIAARAAGREDGFTDKEAANVLSFVRAFNGGKNNKDALREAALSQLSDKNASEDAIQKKIREILEACKKRA